MNQGNKGPTAGKRVLTAEQKRAILQKRKLRRLKKRLLIIVPIVLVLLVAVILLLTLGKGEKDHAPDVQAAITGQLAVDASSSAEPEAATTPVPEVFDFDEAYVLAVKGEVTGPENTYSYSGIDPAKRDRWTEAKAGYIPVLRNAKTNEKIIAVTVDDCYQGENFRKIVECAIENNADLTVFPIGNNLSKADVTAALKLAFENGFEIGNNTYHNVGMYHYDQERMINEIWYHQQAVNRALGVNYKQNFFRPRGGDERDCQRVHAYLNQIGYRGIAMWNADGSNEDMEKLLAGLAPGNIYLFHTTDNDLERLLEFIPGAIARGYTLVTLSDMFGLPQPAISQYKAEEPKPLQAFKVLTHDMRQGTCTRSAAAVQQRLIDLGWMSGESTGFYGLQTVMGVGFFQMALGEEAPDGVADLELQKIIFSDEAPKGSLAQVQQFCRQLGKKVLSTLPGTLNE